MIHAKLDPKSDKHKSIIDALGRQPASASIPLETQQEIGELITGELANPLEKLERGKDTLFGPHSAIKFVQDLFDEIRTLEKRHNNLEERYGHLSNHLGRVTGFLTAQEVLVTVNNWAKVFGVRGKLIPDLHIDGLSVQTRRNERGHLIEARHFLEFTSYMEKEGTTYKGSQRENRTKFLGIKDVLFEALCGVTAKEAEQWFNWEWKDSRC